MAAWKAPLILVGTHILLLKLHLIDALRIQTILPCHQGCANIEEAVVYLSSCVGAAKMVKILF